MCFTHSFRGFSPSWWGGEGREKVKWGQREEAGQKREAVSLFLSAVKKQRRLLYSPPCLLNPTPRTKIDPALPSADSAANRETFGSLD